MLVIVAFFLAGCATSQLHLVRVPTTVELMEALDLHMWWMPAGEWSIALAGAQPLGDKDAGLMHAGGETIVSMRPLANGVYEYTVGGRHGTIDAGGAIRFFDTPRCNADCSAYIAGEAGTKQIVLTRHP